ncbi:hypothetical protein AOZ06_46020 [Kibdelosporangium phytohabitans]|uniref:Uncharacterized protein n=1 Tax=Kibdelosporangium phytohabitans TaxID=860235 RepID=A0A0N9I646_9PSEU|nr:hypothetical protein AOZ06_46020 [Kibdelosporangium phytohabitans]
MRQQVRAFAAGNWGEPAGMVHLGEVAPSYRVPGRRDDGTVKGKKLIRRFFWNITRGVFGVIANIFALANGGGAGNVFSRSGTVSGAEGSQAVRFVDAARPAKSAWLVYAASYVAVIDSGSDVRDPKNIPPLIVLWHAGQPHIPRVMRGVATWADGSEFRYVPTPEEAQRAAQERRDRLHGP